MQTFGKVLGFFQKKQMLDHFKGIFPAKIEAYLCNFNYINIAIKAHMGYDA